MKKYRLKQWYPSLGGDFKNGEKIIFWEERGCYVKNFGDDISLRKTEVENNPDFWELIEEKKPLFTTEDGVECFDGDEYIAISYDFSKVGIVARANAYTYNLGAPYSSDVMRFKHESNADEYILWNKPLLSLKDIDEAVVMYYHEFDELKKLAEERVEQ